MSDIRARDQRRCTRLPGTIFRAPLLAGLLACLCGAAGGLRGQTWKSFELVYYDPSEKFNGQTPFNVDSKSGLNPEARIEYLRRYANALKQRVSKPSEYYAFDEVPVEAARERARQIKEQPLPRIRKVVPLKYWRWKLEGDRPGRGLRDESWVVRHFEEEALWNEMEAPRLFAFNRDAWLRGHFRGPEAQRVLLSIGSIIDRYDIWINGLHVAAHNGFEPAMLDVTRFVEQGGENVIAIRIDNKPNDQIGLADEIEVLGVSEAYLSDCFIKTERAQGREAMATLEIEVTQRGAAAFQGHVKVEITPWFPKEGASSAFSETLPVRIPGEGVEKLQRRMELRGIDLWGPDTPNLYLVRATLQEGEGASRDDLIEVTGFRRIEQRQGRFFLNGEPWFLKSFGDNLGFPPGFGFSGEVCPPDEWIVRDFLLAKGANANAIRLHPWGFGGEPGRYSELAWPNWGVPNSSTNYRRIAWIGDQLGIGLVWGTRLWTLWGADFQSKYADGSWEARLGPSLRHIRNRASILIYEGLNEVGWQTIAVRGELEQRYHRFCGRYLELVNQVDDSRLVIPDTPWGPDVLDPPQRLGTYLPNELFTFIENTFWADHTYFGWYSNLPEQLLRDSVADRPFVLNESGAEAMPDWRLYRGLPWYGLWLNNGRPSNAIERDRLGRPLRILKDSEFVISQAYQGLVLEKTVFATRFSAAEGLNINLIADGLAEGNYHKGVCDINRNAKLGYFAAQMVWQPVCSAGAGLDFVLGERDQLHVQVAAEAGFRGQSGRLEFKVFDDSGKAVEQKQWMFVFEKNQRVTKLGDYLPRFHKKGLYLLQYTVSL